MKKSLFVFLKLCILQLYAWKIGFRSCRQLIPLYMKDAGNQITIPSVKHFSGELRLPGSKSLSNRVLLLSALSNGMTRIQNVLRSDDVEYMLTALEQLKVNIDRGSNDYEVAVHGIGGPFQTGNESLFLGNAGTALRSFTGVLCAGSGVYNLTGTPRMQERPIQELVDGLRQIGGQLSCSKSGCPPVRIVANQLNGGETTISGRISSQFISALLLASPLAKRPVTIRIIDDITSLPYVIMTIKLMEKFGIHVDNIDNKLFKITPQTYQSPGTYFVEGDASSASYFLAAAAICGGNVTVHGVGSESLQGDVRFASLLKKMGANVQISPNSITVHRSIEDGSLVGIDEDCGDIPDVAMTLAMVAVFARGKTTIRNVYSWRLKETERMVAMVTELSKLGAKVEEGRDHLIVHGISGSESLKRNCEIDTYDDHRMAMCFSLIACGGVPVIIRNPSCTFKTFPNYFEEFLRMANTK